MTTLFFPLRRSSCRLRKEHFVAARVMGPFAAEKRPVSSTTVVTITDRISKSAGSALLSNTTVVTITERINKSAGSALLSSTTVVTITDRNSKSAGSVLNVTEIPENTVNIFILPGPLNYHY